MNNFSIFILLMLFVSGYQLNAQDVPGCTDPQANNYDREANVNDGSCTYNPTFYSPGLKYLLPDVLDETSGLIYYNDGLWTINDSGNDPILYKIDTINGNILQQITVSNGTNIDWESLAQDDEYIFIGDFGNNNGNRDDLRIYMVSKEDLPAAGDGSVNSYHISYTYSDYPGKIEKRGVNNFDCEAFLAIDDSLYLFSKNWRDNQTKLYRLTKTTGNQEAEKIYTFNTAGLVTGADYNEESGEIVLIGYSQETIPFLWLLFDYHDNLVFSGNKRRIDLVSIAAAQTEAIAYTQGKHGFLSSEGNALYTQSAHGYYTGTWSDQQTTGLGDRQAEYFDFALSPNPVRKSKLNVNIKNLPLGDYQIKLFDTSGSLMQINNYSLRIHKGEVKVKLNIGHLKPGLYFIRMQSVNTIVEKKFVKQ